MNKNYIGCDYYCPVCKLTYEMTDDMLDEVGLKHDCGEELEIVTAQCPHCESMSIPEGMNQIAWIMPINQE